MSLLGSAGAGGNAGHSSPLVPPTLVSMTRDDTIGNGSTPNFIVSKTDQTQVGNKQFLFQGYYIYRASDNAIVRTWDGINVTNPITMLAGTSYYTKTYIKDIVTNTEAWGTKSSDIVALTKPADPGTVSASSYAGGVQFSWSAVNNGGDSVGFYYQLTLFKNGVAQSTFSTTSTSYSYSDSVTTNYYSLRVRSGNSLNLSTNSSTSGNVYPQAVGPYFPYFPYFPSFGSGRRCTSSNYSMGMCYSINCCCFPGSCSGSTCSPSVC